MVKKGLVRNWLAVTLACLIMLPVLLESQPLLSDENKKAILNEFSGLKALDYIYDLCIFDRSRTKGLYDSQVWVSDKLKKWGITDISLDAFPADGSRIYLDTHPAGYAWEISRAVLSLVEPEQRRIVDYSDIPTSLIKNSNSANVTAELIDVGGGLEDRDYLGKDVKGKIVFTSGNAYSVYRKALIEHGAEGIVSYWQNEEPDRSRFPDQVPWMSIPQELDSAHFGFAISANMAAELKQLLSNGRVIVKADVIARNEIGRYHVLSSSLPGTELPEKEIILTAHINHHKPGANDNASGCAMLMEIERATKSIIESGLISPPKRSIRFVWASEHTGTKVYIDSRPDIADRGIMAVNLDMVGENVLLCESSLRLVLGPHSCPSFLDDLMNCFLKDVMESNITEPQGTKIPFTYSLEKYNGAISDHYYYPAGGIAIPTSFLNLWPDNYFHSNEDTPDKCDPTMMKRLGFVTMAAALYIASAGEDEAVQLSNLVYGGSAQRLSRAVYDGMESLRDATMQNLYVVYKETVNKLRKIAQKEEKAIKSVFRLSQTPKVVNNVNRLVLAINRISNYQLDLVNDTYSEMSAKFGEKIRVLSTTDLEDKFDRIIPLRKFRGPLNLVFVKKKMSREKVDWFDAAERSVPDFFLIKDEIVNFVDGSNSVLDIRNAISAEFYPIDLDIVYNFLAGIQEAGYMSFASVKGKTGVK